MLRKVNFFLLFFLFYTSSLYAETKPVFLLPIKGVINPITSRQISEGITYASKKKANLLIIRLDTPGGLLVSTRVIVEEIMSADIPVAVYVAPSGAQCASAGTFIALASPILAMAPATNIGAAHPVMIIGRMGKEMEEKVVNDAVSFIKGIAKNKGLEVTAAELDGFKNQLLAEEGVDELVSELYGWNLDEYADRVLKPLALAQKVEADYYDSDLLKSLQAQMDGYVVELAKDPGRFEEIASQVNDDSTKFVDGDLGWFSLGDMVPEFEAALLDLEPGFVSQVVETRFGLHLIKLEEKLINDANQTTFHARHIFKQVPPFADYLDEEIKKATVITLIRL